MNNLPETIIKITKYTQILHRTHKCLLNCPITPNHFMPFKFNEQPQGLQALIFLCVSVLHPEFASPHLCRFYTSYMQTVYKLVTCNCHLLLSFFFQYCTYKIYPKSFIIQMPYNQCYQVLLTNMMWYMSRLTALKTNVGEVAGKIFLPEFSGKVNQLQTHSCTVCPVLESKYQHTSNNCLERSSNRVGAQRKKVTQI